MSREKRVQCGPDCDHEKPVTTGGEYPDDWVPAHISYATPGDHEPAEDFEEHALNTLQFSTSREFDGSCLECGYTWMIAVHEDRDDQQLNDWEFWCPHCGSEAVVAQEKEQSE